MQGIALATKNFLYYMLAAESFAHSTIIQIKLCRRQKANIEIFSCLIKAEK